MKRLLIPITAFLLCLIAAATWLLYSSSGARFLVSLASRIAPVTISTGGVSGRAAGDLSIKHLEVRLRQTPISISVGSLRFSWRPIRLLEGTLGIDRLHLQDVHIVDNRPKTKTPFAFSWPRLSRLPAGLHGWVREFKAGRVRYTRLGESLLEPVDLTARILWHHGSLTVSGLAVEALSLRGNGTIEAGFLRPRLKIDGTIDLDNILGDFTRLAVATDLDKAPSPEELAGTVSVRGHLGSGAQATFDGRIGLLRDRIDVHAFRLTYPAIAGHATGKGMLVFGVAEPYLRVDSRLKEVGLKENGASGIRAAGDLHVVSNKSGYEGTFSVLTRVRRPKTERWQTVNADGAVKGDWERCAIDVSKAAWLGGRVTGKVELAWSGRTFVTAKLHGRGFDPTYLSPEWTGQVNADAELSIEEIAAGEGQRSRRAARPPFKGTIRASFPDSTLRGQSLTGDVAASFDPDTIRLERLKLRGNGFDIRASGVLEERMSFDLGISDLRGLVPSASGRGTASGWFRRSNGRFSGEVSGKSSDLEIGEARIGQSEFSARLGNTEVRQIWLKATGRGVGYADLEADRASVSVEGKRDNHLISGNIQSGRRDVRLSLQGGQTEKSWSGSITGFSGKDEFGTWAMGAPVSLFLSPGRLQIGRMRLASDRREGLDVQGDIFFDPLRGSVKTGWESLDLERLQAFSSSPPFVKVPRPRSNGAGPDALRRKTFPLTGVTTGDLSVDWPDGRGRTIVGQAKIMGRYRGDLAELPLTARMQLGWKDSGLSAEWDLSHAGGTITGRISASGPPMFALPERATAKAEWKAIDLASFRPWLPENLSLNGQLAGSAEGEILPGGAVSLAGRTAIDKGSAGWQTGKGLLTTAIEDASVRFTWSGASLGGELAIALTDYGKADGSFSLPLPARLPPAFVADGPVSLTLKGKMKETGLITALIPTAIQETKGAVDLDVTAKGTWQSPVLSGGMTLRDASAYVPAAGVRLERVQGQASFAGEELKVRLRGESGGGWLEAAGGLRIEKKGGLRYDGSLEGQAFQVLRLPEVRAFATPRIRFQGDSKLFSARGDINVPRMSIYGTKGESVVRRSPDIVVVDAPVSRKAESPIALDVQLRVTLGDNVRIESQGVDARLAGALDLTMAATDKISARGRIRMVDGGYKAYGVRLSIARGNINFFGPVDRPTLDILAVRKVEDVTAGVQVSGSSRSPVITLYSTPPMSDSDRLSYIILGHRLNTADTSGAGTIAGAAGLFEGGATPTMTSEARRRLGLQGPPGTSTQEEAARSMVSIGRYLTPGFYVGIGRSLITDENLVTLRYNLSKSWQVESRLGRDTGMDIFYRIEFD